jgi:glycosyltransferase involved in cell wall biosynthesis
MKVLHVTPAFYPAANWGGFTQSVPGLCDALARQADVQLKVLTTDSNGPKTRRGISVEAFPTRFPAGYEVYYCRRLWGQSVSWGLLRRLWSMTRWADVVHLTATYSFPTIPTLVTCRLLGKPVVWSPRGALQRWQGTTRARTKLVWEKVCNALCDPQRVVLHTTSEEEKNESWPRMARTHAKVIHNGINLPNLNGSPNKRNGNLRLLYLGRLHPIKGIENLLQAVARVKSNVTLSVCGDGDASYRQSLESLVSELSLNRCVTFHGRIDEEGKARQFHEADLCVVPSFKENFSMVVAESLARAVPVIVGDGTPWKQVDEIACGRCVPNTPEGLARAIEALSESPLREMGLRGRSWMEREFGWEAVAQNMAVTYRELIASYAGSQPQEFV